MSTRQSSGLLYVCIIETERAVFIRSIAYPDVFSIGSTRFGGKDRAWNGIANALATHLQFECSRLVFISDKEIQTLQNTYRKKKAGNRKGDTGAFEVTLGLRYTNAQIR